MNNEHNKIRVITEMGLLSATVVVLQMFGSYINFGGFSPSLVLVPVVIGAILHGPAGGAVLGGIFGIITMIGCITGSDKGGAVLWNANAFFTVLITLCKGVACGTVSGLVFNGLKRKNSFLGSVLASVLCPLVNTLVFCIFVLTVFRPVLEQWAGGTNLVTYILFSLIGINFIVEVGVNVILCPAIYRIISHARKR